MFLELIATFVIGFGGAGLIMILNFISGRRLPRWLLPVGAGAAMIGFTIWSEYNWFNRTTALLPDEVVIVSTNENQALYRPWTYLRPYVDRLAAVDVARIRRNENVPDQVMVPMIFMGRWAPGSEVPVLIDCAGSRQAPLADGMDFAEDGRVANADWADLAADSPILDAVCQ